MQIEQFDAFVELLNHLCYTSKWEAVDGLFTSVFDYDIHQATMLILFTAPAKEFLPSREQFSQQYAFAYPRLATITCR